MSHHRYTSTSSYDPILTRPTPHSRTSSSSTAQTPKVKAPRLKYPYPLPILSLVDLGYTVHATTRRSVSGHFLPLCIARTVVVCGAVGGITRWRFRGGWIAGGSGVTVLAAVWEVCKDRLDPRKAQEMDTTFLLLTALVAVVEYMLFLLLLRLSPPPHRLNPLSLRLPRSAIQTPTAFDYSAGPDLDEDSDSFSPTASPTRRTNTHVRQPSSRTARSASTYVRDQDDPDGSDLEDEDEIDEGNGADMLDDDSASSISESSIIDLPPAQDPARIVPPPSLSMANLNAILSEEAPVIGPLVRRTRSARLLARSWGRESGLAEAMGGTYGTFGLRSGQNQGQATGE